MARGFPLLAVTLVALGAPMALPAAGSAAIRLGPPDVSIPRDVGASCSGIAPGTCSNILLSGGALAQSPIDGVVVRWRAQSNGAAHFTPSFRILRAAPAGYTGVATTDPVPEFTEDVGEFPTRLSIKKNDYIGIDLPQKVNTCAPCVGGISGGGNDARWQPALANDEMPGRPPDFSDAITLLINADVEPDTDGDAFGDETQDKCVGAGGAQDGCPPPAVSKPVPPHASLSGSTSQDVLRQGAVIVFITSAEAGSASATGTINLPGASKVYSLSPASSSLAPGAKTRLKLKLSKKTKKAVRKALKKRKKPKASIAVTVKSTAGGSTAIKRTVKIKRKKR